MGTSSTCSAVIWPLSSARYTCGRGGKDWYREGAEAAGGDKPMEYGKGSQVRRGRRGGTPGQTARTRRPAWCSHLIAICADFYVWE